MHFLELGPQTKLWHVCNLACRECVNRHTNTIWRTSFGLHHGISLPECAEHTEIYAQNADKGETITQREYLIRGKSHIVRLNLFTNSICTYSICREFME